MKRIIIKMITATLIMITFLSCFVGCSNEDNSNKISNLEEYFSIMQSNSLSSSANQTIFYPIDENQEYTGRVFYKVFNTGKYNYSFLFSSVTDSSYPNINFTKCNTELLEWEIVDAKIGVAKTCDMQKMPDVFDIKQLYFDGQIGKKIDKAELFYTDKIELDLIKDEYICLEVTYKGKAIPHHYENSIPAFKKNKEKWIASNEAIFAQMIGCDRKADKKIAFIGDSITQGLGVEKNSYKHWAALVGEGLGENYAFWNLGIGYSTANDCATDKLWMYKAKQNDIVFVCFGINDIGLFNDEQQTKADLLKIVNSLNQAGCKVILQTLPPFNHKDKKLEEWNNLNSFIKEELSKQVYAVFDVSPLLADGDVKNAVAKYGAHPNEEGCQIWAENLLQFIKTNNLI